MIAGSDLAQPAKMAVGKERVVRGLKRSRS